MADVIAALGFLKMKVLCWTTRTESNSQRGKPHPFTEKYDYPGKDAEKKTTPSVSNLCGLFSGHRVNRHRKDEHPSYQKEAELLMF